jgi:hypothetical protein
LIDRVQQLLRKIKEFSFCLFHVVSLCLGLLMNLLSQLSLKIAFAILIVVRAGRDIVRCTPKLSTILPRLQCEQATQCRTSHAVTSRTIAKGGTRPRSMRHGWAAFRRGAVRLSISVTEPGGTV